MLAVKMAAVWEDTGNVVIVNVAVVAPGRIATEVGGVALAMDETTAMDIPDAGAGLEIVTVPVDDAPP